MRPLKGDAGSPAPGAGLADRCCGPSYLRAGAPHADPLAGQRAWARGSWPRGLWAVPALRWPGQQRDSGVLLAPRWPQRAARPLSLASAAWEGGAAPHGDMNSSSLLLCPALLGCPQQTLLCPGFSAP